MIAVSSYGSFIFVGSSNLDVLGWNYLAGKFSAKKINAGFVYFVKMPASL